MVTFGKRKSKSSELAELIRQQILDGRLRPGERLPGIRDMARQYGVTWQVMWQTCHFLAEAGLVLISSRQSCEVNPNLEVGGIHEAPLRIGYLYWRMSLDLLSPASYGGLALAYLRSVAQAHNCIILSAEQDIAPQEFFRKERLNALIVDGLWDDALAAELVNSGLPYVLLGNRHLTVAANHISFDLENNMYHAFRQLLSEQGFRRCAAVVGHERYLSTVQFSQGWRRAMAEGGMSEKDSPIICTNGHPNATRIFEEIFLHQPVPDCIFLNALYFPALARCLFRNHLDEAGRKPFIVVDTWADNMFYPELVDRVFQYRHREMPCLLPRLLDIYYGRIKQPVQETIPTKPPYCQPLPNSLLT
ncbi:MAG: GntR family transcriptional regulator [Victivallales bacterium]|nr:GntR family transcriptional regulator [Victivallales bacterium]